MQEASTQNRLLQEKLQKRDATILFLQAELNKAKEENALLREQITELKERLNQNSTNSSKPPSSDTPGTRGEKDKPKRRAGKKKKKRKRGGQPGHPGKHRALIPSEQANHHIDYYPEECEQCWSPLEAKPDPDPQRYQVTELPEVKPQVTEFRAHGVTCTCGHTTRAKLPDHVKVSPFGPRLTSIISMLTGVYHLSRRMAEAAMLDLFGVNISLGAVSAAENRVSQAVEPAVNECWTKAQQAEVKHTDGTTWYQAGQSLQLWTIATTAVTVFKVVADGTAETLKALLGRIKGILVSDRATALTFWAMKRRQICWAHLLRKFVSFAERDGPAQRFGQVLLEYTGIMFDLYRVFKEGNISRRTFQHRMAPLRVQFEAVLMRAVQAKIKRLSGSCKNILVHREALWTFIDHPQVEPTNNHAERELRRFVLWRKRSFGTQSERGNHFAERVMTVVHTARKQNKPVLAYLTAACEAHRFGDPCPSLFA